MLNAVKSLVKRAVIHRLIRADARTRHRLGAAFNGLPPSLWGYDVDSAGDLSLLGNPVAELAAQFGTPLHLVNLPHLRETYAAFHDAMRRELPAVRLATSYKTNPVPAVLRALHDLGTDAEVISDFELWLAGELGLPGDRVIVNGPGKSKSMLDRAVAMGVRIVNIDGVGEIDAVAQSAERHGRVQRVGLRVVTSVGWSAQFGVPIANGAALAAFERIAGNRWLEPAGIHLHLGTGLKSPQMYAQAVRELLDFTGVLLERLGIRISVLDLGGGFAVPTVRGMNDWDLRMISMGYPAREAIPSQCPAPSEFAEVIGRLFRERYSGTLQPEIVLEPGRAITSSAQALVLSVVAVKESGAGRSLILDGGKNISLPLAWECHKIFPVRQPGSTKRTQTNLYGPLCHPGDIVASNLLLPPAAVGDVLIVMDSGAYFVPNQMNFSNPRPAILTVDESQVRIVRRREGFDDLVKLDALT